MATCNQLTLLAFKGLRALVIVVSDLYMTTIVSDICTVLGIISYSRHTNSCVSMYGSTMWTLGQRTDYHIVLHCGEYDARDLSVCTICRMRCAISKSRMRN